MDGGFFIVGHFPPAAPRDDWRMEIRLHPLLDRLMQDVAAPILSIPLSDDVPLEAAGRLSGLAFQWVVDRYGYGGNRAAVPGPDLVELTERYAEEGEFKSRVRAAASHGFPHSPMRRRPKGIG